MIKKSYFFAHVRKASKIAFVVEREVTD